MSELSGKQRYVLLTKHGVLVRPDQKKTATEYSDRRGVSINQTIRDLIDFGHARGFFTPLIPTNENIPADK
jgi:hypothetical protein